MLAIRRTSHVHISLDFHVYFLHILVFSLGLTAYFPYHFPDLSVFFIFIFSVFSIIFHHFPSFSRSSPLWFVPLCRLHVGPLHRHHRGGGLGCGEGQRQSGAGAAGGAAGGAVEEAATWTTVARRHRGKLI